MKLKPATCLFIFYIAGIIMPGQEKITIWLIGDSTASVKMATALPETGWGMPFAGFWDSTVTVENRARNGRSSKSFRSENLWEPILSSLREGDYVFIQFGHNDESKDKGERYSTPEEYKKNIWTYVEETKKKNAIPVLLTPVARRKFDSEGKITNTHHAYSEMVKELAKENGIIVFDLDLLTRELMQKFGPERSKQFFNHLDPGQHPNYPDGKKDDTHLNELGARKVAALVLTEIKRQLPDLAGRIKQPG